MGKPKAARPEDPVKVAGAQTGANISTATANAWLGNINEYTPDGSTEFKQTGTQQVWDPNQNKYMDVPTFSRYTSLSPEQAAIQAQTNGAELNLAKTANQQANFLSEYLGKPFDGSNAATEARIIELGRQRLDPMLARQDEDLRTRLANQGIRAGSAAYDREMQLQNQSRNDAMNQLILSGRGQAFSEAQATRNQPINEITALLSGSQVSQPEFMGANMPKIPTTDYAGLYQQDFNNRMGVWQQKNAQQQSMLGGLLGFGGSLLSLSDKRAKENIERVGSIAGQKIYKYTYKNDPSKKKYFGVMAQEVEKKRPDAVVDGPDGLKRVDYRGLFDMGD